MGRPRKRQFIETNEKEETLATDPLDLLPAPYIVDVHNGYNDMFSVDSYPMNNSSLLVSHSLDHGFSKPEPPPNIWQLGTGGHILGPPINFAESRPQNSDVTPTTSDALQQGIGSIPSSSDSANSPSSSITPGPCSCLASMYLALSSLQQLPADITAALKTVRGAAGTASSCIWCPRCGSVVLEDLNPPIESFQNTMLLYVYV
jgi:hypothetical protein